MPNPAAMTGDEALQTYTDALIASMLTLDRVEDNELLIHTAFKGRKARTAAVKLCRLADGVALADRAMGPHDKTDFGTLRIRKTNFRIRVDRRHRTAGAITTRRNWTGRQ